MRTRLLDRTTHDLVRRGGGFVWIEGDEQIRQSIKVRLLTIAGEWFQDPTIGLIDLIEGRMFGKGVSLPYIRKRIVEEILATPGMTGGTAEITSLVLSSERELVIDWRGKTAAGAAISDSVTVSPP
jgi:hypothetical protein